MRFLKMTLMISLLFLISGCVGAGTGKYNTGTYFGYDENSKYTAVVYVDETGMIKSVFVDGAYLKKNSDGSTTATTKQILGDAYGMKANSKINAEWYEQVNKIANKVVQEQGIGWLEFKYKTTDESGNEIFTSDKPNNQKETDKVYTDTVAGVTIHVSETYNAIINALDKAKK